MFTVKKCRIVYNDLVLFVPYFNKSIMFDIVTVGAGTIAVGKFSSQYGTVSLQFPLIIEP
jgi:hypothetical protein